MEGEEYIGRIDHAAFYHPLFLVAGCRLSRSPSASDGFGEKIDRQRRKPSKSSGERHAEANNRRTVNLYLQPQDILTVYGKTEHDPISFALAAGLRDHLAPKRELRVCWLVRNSDHCDWCHAAQSTWVCC